MQIDINRIKELIPHRYPFLLIDGIQTLTLDESATGIKNVSVKLQINTKINNLIKKLNNNSINIDTGVLKNELKILFRALNLLLENNAIKNKIDSNKLYNQQYYIHNTTLQ